jgi:hypothetical protein
MRFVSYFSLTVNEICIITRKDDDWKNGKKVISGHKLILCEP